MKVWCCLLIMYFGLLTMNSAATKPNSESASLVSQYEISKAMKTSPLSPLKAKETRKDWIVNKAVATPKSIKLGGNGLIIQKNNRSYITGTGMHSKR